MRWVLVLLVVLVACGPTDPQVLRASAVVKGQFSAPGGLDGDAWLFLYEPGRGPPAEPAVPLAVTAVSAQRLREGAPFVFGEVGANPYRLFGLLDVDSSFRADVDVLAQPTAGDRIGAGLELNVQPGRPLELDYAATVAIEHEPPAFRLENAQGSTVPLDATQAGPTVLTLVSDPVGRFDPTRTGFVVGLVDDDGDGRPDDRDGDRVPDLSLFAFLRWLPRPGQHPSGTDVIVPLLFDPSALLSNLGMDVRARLVVPRLSVVVVPQAQEIAFIAGRRTVTPYGPPAAGEYELVVSAGAGQFWRLPNALADQVEGQGLTFRFERARP